MGYYTNFALGVRGPKTNRAIISEALHEVSGYLYLFDGERKWYNHEKDCLTVSSQHPSITFAIFARGEEGEEWHRVYSNGACIEVEYLNSTTPEARATAWENKLLTPISRD